MSGQATAFIPSCISHSSGCISICTFCPDDLLRFTCLQWQPVYFFENKPHMPKSYPSPMFPYFFSHAFPSAPPPGFHVVLHPCFCPRLSLPCAPSEQAVTGVTGSSSGRVLCGQLSSAVVTQTGNHLRTAPRIPTSTAQLKGFCQPDFRPGSPRALATHQKKGS